MMCKIYFYYDLEEKTEIHKGLWLSNNIDSRAIKLSISIELIYLLFPPLINTKMLYV